jgi:hypothetical protein
MLDVFCGAGAKSDAAMLAGVLEGAELAVAAADDQDRVAANSDFMEIPGIRDVVDTASNDPGLRPNVLVFELGELLRPVPVRGYLDRTSFCISDRRDRGPYHVFTGSTD